ncbi:MAG: AAA family ATPase [Chlamydiales bacterium]|nr:AAA family ATPase [Chlamydiales bacterium]
MIIFLIKIFYRFTPILLNEVHRLIETYRYKFILTGSSARTLKRKGTNLLAGRALYYKIFPLTAIELGSDFSIEESLVIMILNMKSLKVFQMDYPIAKSYLFYGGSERLYFDHIEVIPIMDALQILPQLLQGNMA